MSTAMLRVRMTKGQQPKICERKRDFPAMSRYQLGAWAKAEYQLSRQPSTAAITGILKRENELIHADKIDFKRKSKGSVDRRKLVDAVLGEVLEMEQKGFLSGRLIKHIAKTKMDEIDTPVERRPRLLNGWLHYFQRGTLLSCKRCSREADSADVAGLERELPALQALIGCYNLNGVYNLDETAFSYNATPRESICRGRAPSLRKDKARITAVLCVNASGSDIRSPWFIRTSMRPRCVNREPKQPNASWRKTTMSEKEDSKWLHLSGSVYVNSKKAWMNAKLFQQYLKEFDDDMCRQGRRALLLIDNASMHIWDASVLANVTVKTLPPNTMSLCRLLDQTVMSSWKAHVLELKVQLWYQRMKANLPIRATFLTAMDSGIMAWCEITPSTTRNG